MVNATLTEVRNLGMQINKYNRRELVDHCTLKFKTEEGEDLETYSFPKTCHASSQLGKIIRVLLGRNLTKNDYIKGEDGTDYFDSSVLLEKSVQVEVSNNKIITVVA